MFSATMLNNLINDMMDLAKMESGTFIFHDDYFDLVEIIQNSFQVLRFLAEKKKIKMSYKIIDERDKSLRIPSASQMSSNFQSASAGSSNYFDSNNASHDPNEILGMTHSSN
jgi:signal transduction histidine kinase